MPCHQSAAISAALAWHRQSLLAEANGVHVDAVGAARLVFALSGAQHDDLVAVSNLASFLQHLVGVFHQVAAGLVVVVLLDQEGFGAPAQSQPVVGMLVVGDAEDRDGRAFAGHAVHGGTGLGVGDDGLGVELLLRILCSMPCFCSYLS